METLKLAMIGLDTSHCEGFVSKVNCEDNEHHVPGMRVVRAFPGGNPALSVSRDRIEGYTKTLSETYGVTMCNSIEEAGSGMDGFLLTSVDGRQHLEQFEILAQFGKPVFIDKPFACSAADAVAIADIARKQSIPMFSASMVRFAPGAAYAGEDRSGVFGCESFGGVGILEDYPAYYWYVIHPADLLYSFMGTGCREVRAVQDETGVHLVGSWSGGRFGTVRGIMYEGDRSYGRVLYGRDEISFGIGDLDGASEALTRHICTLMQTGESPLELEETVEIMAFLEAAQASSEKGGEAEPIRL